MVLADSPLKSMGDDSDMSCDEFKDSNKASKNGGPLMKAAV